jgi:hypothetical protein
MGKTERAARLAPYAQEFLANAYAQENLSDGIEKFRAAYQRGRKRRVEPTRDERIREQLRSATRSLTEAGRALRSGRRKPKPRWGVRVMVIAGLGVAGAAAALWAKERLGDESTTAQPNISSPGENSVQAARETTPA